ncbi:site-specific integrase [Pseudomonas sichuanensis]|uniref:site-specific integrase n=1 Tax=Pseudomonas sichuanensis TaxID=2213015 RepID=UPI002160C981|nr:site-specific integrase [Pseudomonas sichuanensis]UVL89464.1 site-specific integrase [Pseudomonas sichuanensis]
MRSANGKTISGLLADEARVVKDLAFTAVCKNTGKVNVYNFGGRSEFESLRDIVGIFAWAVYKRRNNVGHITRITVRENLWRFLRFLKEFRIEKPEQLRGTTLTLYAAWLKRSVNISYSSAAASYRLLVPYFKVMSQHESINNDFKPQKNAFPKASSLQVANPGYDQKELEAIVRAAVAGMRQTMSKCNNKYIPRWLGKAAPLDDVAPLSDVGGRSFWNSFEYKVWWWENKCDCKRLGFADYRVIAQGEVFVSSFKEPGRKRMRGVEAFYELIGAGQNYVPRYLGRPCPVSYLSPWRKMDYLIWYWENHLGCEFLTEGELRKRAPKFMGAIHDHYKGRLNDFFTALGVYRQINAGDLVPFFIMLLIRTQLNPSTIERLKIDCLVPDPTDSSRFHLEWVKYRSSKKGKTVPLSEGHSSWPIMLVKKVRAITSRIRGEGQTELWITNGAKLGMSKPLAHGGFRKAMREFSAEHNLKHTSGEPLFIQARLIKPTMGWKEYIRTEDMRFLQAILGHEKISTTADYLRRVGDPVFKVRRGLHINTMFLTLGGDQESGALKGKLTEGFLNHCADPKNSPVPGQKEGEYCSAKHEVCTGCPNLIITFEDIKKYFCFIAYHERLRDAGLVDDVEFRIATSEKIFAWENSILPRYSLEVIERIREDARINPIDIWSFNS